MILLMTSVPKDMAQELAQRKMKDVLTGKRIQVEEVDGVHNTAPTPSRPPPPVLPASPSRSCAHSSRPRVTRPRAVPAACMLPPPATARRALPGLSLSRVVAPRSVAVPIAAC